MPAVVQFVDSIGDTYAAITDSFTRSVTDGLGSTDTGQAYTLQGTAANFDVTGSAATVGPTTINSDYTAYVTTAADNDVTETFQINTLPASGTFAIGVLLRQLDLSNRYLADAQIASTGGVTLRIRKRVAGVQTTLTTVTSLTISAATNYKIRARIVDGQIYTKLWLASGAEPAWALTAFDADLPTGTQAGIFVRNDTAVTTHVATIDNLSIVAPSMVRLDLNSWAGGLMVQPDGIQLDPPDLNRAGGGSLLVDGFYPTGATFGNRTIGLPLQVLPTATADQIATTLQSLHRELNRPTNFLRIQLAGMTSAVWFRTLRAPDYTFKMLRLQLVDNTQALLEIPAEPFGYGRREMLPAVTVTNDPAAGSNGQFFDVTGVKGDVQTPLSMSVSTGVLSGGANPDTNRFISHLATRRRGDPTALTWFVQCESMTMGTDTSANANTADSGGSRALCTFATVATMTNRVSTTFPSAPNDEIRGTYRVYLRCRASASGHGPMSVQLTWGSIDGTAASVYANNTVSIGVDVGPSAPTFRYVDLGTVTIPPLAPADDFGGRAITPEGIFLGVSAARASGTGSLDLDVLLLIPADDQTLLIRWPGTASTPTDVILDATSRVGASGVPALTVYARTAGGLTRALMPARPRGGPIHISPGVTNRVWFIKDVGLDNPDNSTGDDKAATITVTPWYHPRYLHLRPATT